MEKTSELLIYLMACSLQGTKPEGALLVNADLEALFRLAKAHSVSAMVCMALEQTDAFCCAEESTRLKWLDAKNKAVRKNMLLDAERHQLEKEFAEHGIWYMPLKGSILKDWYPKFGMREMADNDILFDPSERKRVRGIFRSRGYKIVSFGKGNHDEYEKPPLYHFEMHVSLFHEMYPKLAGQYRNVKEKLLPVDGTVCQFAFTPEDFYVFALAHAYKHYSGSGTGVRTLADFYVMNHHLGGIMNWDEVKQKLTRLGIAEYEQHSRVLAEKLFSGARPLPEIELNTDEKEMLRFYCNATTYGTIDNQIQNRLHELQGNAEGITLGTKLKYCCARLFPGKEFCKYHYPFVYRHLWLLPFFWVWRMADKGISHRKKVKRELTLLREHQ